MLEPYIGLVLPWAGPLAPKGWELCNGELLPIAQFTALYSLLGNRYGGDGITRFALPDLRGRLALGTEGTPLTYIIALTGRYPAAA